jgi:hypothetical protein
VKHITTTLSLLAGLLLAALAAAVPAEETPTGNPRLYPAGQLKEQAQAARAELHKQVEALVASISIEQEVMEGLRKNNDGSPAARARIAFLNARLMHDRALLSTRASTGVEHLCASLDKARKAHEFLAGERQLAVQTSQARMSRLAEQIIALEEKLAQVKSGPKAEEHALQVQDRKAELAEVIRTNDAHAAAARKAQQAVDAYKREAAEVRKFRRHLESLNRQAQERVARLSDSLEQESVAGPPEEEVNAYRETFTRLRSALDRARGGPEPDLLPPEVPPAPRASEAIERALKAPAPPFDARRVEEVLNRVRARHGATQSQSNK